MGFLTGQEIDWLPHAPSLLRDQLPEIEIRVVSGFSTNLADDLQRGKLDVAFLRPEQKPDLEYRLVTKEPLVAILPSDHRLTGDAAIDPQDLAGETFIGVSDVAPVLRSVIMNYLKRSGLEIVPAFEIDNYAMAMSFVTSTRGVALLPASVAGWLSQSIASRPLAGEQPTVDLMVGYHKANASPILEKFLSEIDQLASRMYKARAGQRTEPARIVVRPANSVP
jgi:LysR family hca operon transcriptional activator